jgi:long-chain fatty acid transport protein
VAAGLDVQHSTATLANMIDFGSIGAAVGVPLTPQGVDGSLRFTGEDWAAGWNAGILWQANSGLRAGAAYRSRIDHALHGTADFTVPPAAEPIAGEAFADGSAAITLPMPAELSTSASYPLTPTWTILGDVTWTDWSRFTSLRLDFDDPTRPGLQQPANWNDSFRVALGASKQLTDWVIRAGVAYETTPVPDATRTPRLPEADHTWISGSATYSGSRRWKIDLHVSHLITPDAAIRQVDAAAGTLDGSVHWRLTVIGAAIAVAF